MLQTMRHLAQSWIFKGLMMLLVVSFAIWGIGDIFRGNPLQRTVATVGGESITAQDLTKEMQSTLILMRRSFGTEMTEQEAKRFGLMDKVLEEMISRRQLEQGSKNLGIDVTDQTIIDEFAERPEFRNPDGSFNKQLFHNAADRDSGSDAAFLAKWRRLIEQRELFYPLASGEKMPQTIIDAVMTARGQKRVLNIVSLANDSVRDIPAPDEKTLRGFYEKNPKLFTAPEYRTLTFARLATADMAKDVVISDDQAKKEYDAHQERYLHPERRDILQAVMQDENKARQLASAAQSGGNLTKAAENLGIKVIPINQTEEKTLLPELSGPVFALKQGQVSDPVKSPLGWHVLQLKKITPPGTVGFDEVKDDLRETMKRDQIADTVSRTANRLDDELGAGRALEDIADALRLRLVKIPEVDAKGVMQDGKEPPELPNKDDVLKAGFGQNAGETSPVIDDKNGNYIVVRTDQVTPSGLRPFEKVKDQVTTAWKQQEQATRAAIEAEKIAKAIRAGKSPSAFTGQSGIEVSTSKPVSLMGDSDPSLPASVLSQVTKMKKGEVVTAAIPGHQLILRLAEFINPDSSKPPKDKALADLHHHLGDELIDEYKQYLADLFPPKINHDVLEGIRRQGVKD